MCSPIWRPAGSSGSQVDFSPQGGRGGSSPHTVQPEALEALYSSESLWSRSSSWDRTICLLTPPSPARMGTQAGPAGGRPRDSPPRGQRAPSHMSVGCAPAKKEHGAGAPLPGCVLLRVCCLALPSLGPLSFAPHPPFLGGRNAACASRQQRAFAAGSFLPGCAPSFALYLPGGLEMLLKFSSFPALLRIK